MLFKRPGPIINKYYVGMLFSVDYLNRSTQDNAISGFRSSGIYIFSRLKISEEYFALSGVYRADNENDKSLPTNTDV